MTPEPLIAVFVDFENLALGVRDRLGSDAAVVAIGAARPALRAIGAIPPALSATGAARPTLREV